jgi:hypothetical protein
LLQVAGLKGDHDDGHPRDSLSIVGSSGAASRRERFSDVPVRARASADPWNQAADAGWNQYVTAITRAVDAWNQAGEIWVATAPVAAAADGARDGPAATAPD